MILKCIPGFNPKVFHVVDKVALKHISIQAFQFSPGNYDLPMLHTHLASMASITGHSTKILHSLVTIRTKLFMQSFHYSSITRS
jgi:hypothetical protein